MVKSIKCTFPLMAVGTWGGAIPKAEVKPSKLVLEFEGINADEGSAQLKSSYGQYLGRLPNDRRLIVTVPGRGYSFVGEVRRGPDRETSPGVV